MGEIGLSLGLKEGGSLPLARLAHPSIGRQTNYTWPYYEEDPINVGAAHAAAFWSGIAPGRGSSDRAEQSEVDGKWEGLP